MVNFVGIALFTVVLPVYATQVFGSVVDLGLVLGAEGAGALAGTLLYGLLAERLPKRSTFIGALMLAGGDVLPLALLPGPLVVALVLAVVGLATGLLNPMIQTVLQERVSQEVLGRVLGFADAISMAAAPLGLLVGGIRTRAEWVTSHDPGRDRSASRHCRTAALHAGPA